MRPIASRWNQCRLTGNQRLYFSIIVFWMLNRQFHQKLSDLVEYTVNRWLFRAWKCYDGDWWIHVASRKHVGSRWSNIGISVTNLLVNSCEGCAGVIPSANNY